MSYKGTPYYTPPLYMDEKKIFRKDFVYNDMCESVHFNAYKDGKMAGRISGILQRAANEKTGEKQVRFSHFDVIEDEEVARRARNRCAFRISMSLRMRKLLTNC